MDNKNIVNPVLRIIFILAAVFTLGILLNEVIGTITFVIISAVLALIGKPFVDILVTRRIKKFHISRSVAAAITLFSMIFLFAGGLTLLLPSLISELSVFSDIDMNVMLLNLDQEINQYTKLFIKDYDSQSFVSGLTDNLISALNFENVADTFQSLVGSLGNAFFAIFSIIFITFFFLKEKHLFRSIILAIVPDKYEAQVLHVSPRLKKNLARYFTGLILQITIITTLISIGLSFVGFSNTIVIGLFAGLINIIPYLGPVIGLSFGLLLGITQSLAGELDSPIGQLVVMIMTVFGIVQLIDNFISQPIIFSNSINAHPLEIFLVISFAATLGGIPGMIIAVPTYSVIRQISMEFFPHVKIVRRLTGIENPRDANQGY